MQALDGSADPQYAVPINQGTVTIDSSFFEGIMQVHLKGLPNSQKAVFDGKKRHFQIMCQVRGSSHNSCTGQMLQMSSSIDALGPAVDHQQQLIAELAPALP
eukprot:GHRQ01034793.1.p2 GENE.GHRQ01034793.1~~GHRQ01034793.1.p2  ORF type:complete len:102 (-),score=30.00 GHRQ01034793.1:181-486(-)